MQRISFSEETIKAIAERINETEIEGNVTYVYDAEFEQDGCLIMVDYEVYAEWRDLQMTHNEFANNNVEDLSGWVKNGASINGIDVYGDDGEDVEFDFEAVKAIEKRVA